MKQKKTASILKKFLLFNLTTFSILGLFTIFYKEKCTSRSIASKRELEIKNLRREQKLKLKHLLKSRIDSA